ncbi:MAG: hypothetical protein N4A41_10480 [Crocinitomicaceae bacterium]|jgi:hypothetical protein|nr:hypothetical protein [Crocinitomicaceae bacterium]
MNHEKYTLQSDQKLLLFEFISIGPKGRIKKVIQYTETNISGIYNLGFGDWDEASGCVIDDVITNNGDSYKVLATVSSSLFAFFDKHPNAIVYIVGSNSIRTRLYRIGISTNLHLIDDLFEIHGLLNDQWEIFNINQNYDAFLISKKP